MPKVALFLGAGASVIFGKPVTSTLKTELKNRYPTANPNPPNSLFAQMLEYTGFPDIEYVLRAVQDVRSFKDTEFLKFLQGRGANLTLANLGLNFNDLARHCEAIETWIQNEVFEKYAWDIQYDSILNRYYGNLFEVLSSENESLPVFTTNYDRAVEEFCSSSPKFTCVDGFVHDTKTGRYLWRPQSFDDPRPPSQGTKNVLLFKLHGSLNWKEHRKHGIERTQEESRISDSSYSKNLVIYPSLSPKDGREVEPFSTVREKFARVMSSVDICIVIGFSFRDEHINEIFRDFISRKTKLVIVSPFAAEELRDNLRVISAEDYNSAKKMSRVFEKNSAKLVMVPFKIDADNYQKLVDEIRGIV